MVLFVLTHENSESCKIIGVYVSDKLAKESAKHYNIESEYKKKQIKKDESKNVLYLENTKENPSRICMTRVDFEMPVVNKSKAKKDPNAPKKPLSAYMLFAKENREKIKKENSDATFGEIGRKLGEAWRSIDKKNKDKFIKKSEKDKDRYNQEIVDYKSTKEAEEADEADEADEAETDEDEVETDEE
jgi:hypothetical protein